MLRETNANIPNNIELKYAVAYNIKTAYRICTIYVIYTIYTKNTIYSKTSLNRSIMGKTLSDPFREVVNLGS